MENVTSPATILRTTAVRYGVLFGIVAILVDFLLKVTGLSFKFSVSISAGVLVWIIGIVMAHREFKAQNGGLMTYGQGLLIAIILTSISALLTGIFNYVYVNYIDPDYVTAMRNDMEQWLMGMNASSEQIQKSLVDINQEKLGSVASIGKSVFGGAIGGLLVGLIVSAITKHKRPEFE